MSTITPTPPEGAPLRATSPLAPHSSGTDAGVRYWVAVDGGGSHTRVRLHDAHGTVLGEAEAGPSGLGQGVQQAWHHILEALQAAGLQAGSTPPTARECALGLGLAGAGRPVERRAFLESNPGFPLLVLHTDAEATLAGAHGGGAGIVVMAGTGSVAAAQLRNGQRMLHGGWGFPVGDEGSGAWLGLRAMGQAQKSLEHRMPSGILSQLLLTECGRQRIDVLHWCAQAGQRGYASLAPLVFSAADQGDPWAQNLIQEAAGHLAALALSFDTDLPIAVSGSIAERLWPLWSPALKDRVRPALGDALTGAWTLLRGTTLG